MHAKMLLYKAFTISKYILSKKSFDSVCAYFHNDFPLSCKILALQIEFYSLADTHHLACWHPLTYLADFKD